MPVVVLHRHCRNAVNTAFVVLLRGKYFGRDFASKAAAAQVRNYRGRHCVGQSTRWIIHKLRAQTVSFAVAMSIYPNPSFHAGLLVFFFPVTGWKSLRNSHSGNVPEKVLSSAM